MLADALKTKQSHHIEKRNLEDANMEIETENTNNEDQILIKVISLKTHVVTDCGAVLHQVFWSGTTFKKVINKYRRYLSPKYKIFQIVFDRYKKKKLQGLRKCTT